MLPPTVLLLVCGIPFFLLKLFFPFRPLERKTTLSPSFATYYLNLDRSTSRRKYIERAFRNTSLLLRRISSLDAHNLTEFKQTVDLHGLSPFEYVKAVGASGIGEVALCASIHKALKIAKRDNVETLLLLEDDMSSILLPYWRWSLESIVKMADDVDPYWTFVQLHVIAHGKKNRKVFHSWKNQPLPRRTPFVRRPADLQISGGGAQLISARGRDFFLQHFTSLPSGKFDCLPSSLNNSEFRCISDWIFWRWNPRYSSFWRRPLLAMPPYFTFHLNEGSTGTRETAAATSAHIVLESLRQLSHQLQTGWVVPEVVVSNDNYKVHYTSIFDSLQANIEAKYAEEAIEAGALPPYVQSPLYFSLTH